MGAYACGAYAFGAYAFGNCFQHVKEHCLLSFRTFDSAKVGVKNRT